MGEWTEAILLNRPFIFWTITWLSYISIPLQSEIVDTKIKCFKYKRKTNRISKYLTFPANSTKQKIAKIRGNSIVKYPLGDYIRISDKTFRCPINADNYENCRAQNPTANEFCSTDWECEGHNYVMHSNEQERVLSWMGYIIFV